MCTAIVNIEFFRLLLNKIRKHSLLFLGSGVASIVQGTRGEVSINQTRSFFNILIGLFLDIYIMGPRKKTGDIFMNIVVIHCNQSSEWS